MFDSHDDDLWEVPSIGVSVPVDAAAVVEAVAPVEAPAAEVAAPAPEPVIAAAPVGGCGARRGRILDRWL